MNRQYFGQIFAVILLVAAATVVTTAQGVNTTTYKLKAGDKISVRFLNHPELNEPVLTIRPDGLISLQMVEDLKAEGVTAEQLKTNIYKAYNEILLNPVISVNVVEFLPPSVFIGGQIQRPGKYSLRDGNTLVKAIFMAGGFTKDANRKMVLYARQDAKGKWSVREVNFLDLMKKMQMDGDVELSDGDYIFIPDSKLSKLNKAIEGFQSFFPILPLL